MSGKAMAWSRTVKVGSSSAKHVLRELCISQNEDTGLCMPSIKTLIEVTELSEPTVLKALSKLKDDGFIRICKRKTKNGWCNSYEFPMIGATSKNEGIPNSLDTPNIEGTPKSKGEGIPNSLDTGIPKIWDEKKEEKTKKKVEAPIGAQPEVAPWELPLEPPAANYADNTLKTVAQPAEKLDSHPADTPAAKAKSATKSDRGTRFTLETLPPEWVAECDRIDPELDPQKVFDDFRDYWIALPGAKGRKSDWLATWRNWLRRIRPQERERLKKEVSQFTCRNPVIRLTDEERRRLSQGPVLDDGDDYDHELESELKELLA